MHKEFVTNKPEWLLEIERKHAEDVARKVAEEFISRSRLMALLRYQYRISREAA